MSHKLYLFTDCNRMDYNPLDCIPRTLAGPLEVQVYPGADPLVGYIHTVDLVGSAVGSYHIPLAVADQMDTDLEGAYFAVEVLHMGVDVDFVRGSLAGSDSLVDHNLKVDHTLADLKDINHTNI